MARKEIKMEEMKKKGRKKGAKGIWKKDSVTQIQGNRLKIEVKSGKGEMQYLHRKE